MTSQPPAGDVIKQITDAIKQATDTLAFFVRWVAELIVTKNWFTLLILIAIALLFVGKPTGGIATQTLLLFLPIAWKPWYGVAFWTLEAGLVLGALAIAIRTGRVAQSPGLCSESPGGVSAGEVYANRGH